MVGGRRGKRSKDLEVARASRLHKLSGNQVVANSPIPLKKSQLLLQEKLPRGGRNATRRRQSRAMAARRAGIRTESEPELLVGGDDASTAKFVQTSALPAQRRRIRRARYLHKADRLPLLAKLAHKTPQRRHSAILRLARNFGNAIREHFCRSTATA